jgi:outer membrane protein OmpA-like peptidoglycan-associated protein
MAELFDEVVALLESGTCTSALAERFGVESDQGASNGAVLGVPVYLSRLSNWVADPSRAAAILQALSRVDPAGLANPAAVVANGAYEPVGSELADTLLGPSRPGVASVIAGEAGIGESNADAMLPATGWFVLTAIAKRFGTNIERKALKGVLKKEESDLLAGGWGQWLDATANDTAYASAAFAEADPQGWTDPMKQATTTPNESVDLAPPIVPPSTPARPVVTPANPTLPAPAPIVRPAAMADAASYPPPVSPRVKAVAEPPPTQPLAVVPSPTVDSLHGPNGSNGSNSSHGPTPSNGSGPKLVAPPVARSERSNPNGNVNGSGIDTSRRSVGNVAAPAHRSAGIGEPVDRPAVNGFSDLAEPVEMAPPAVDDPVIEPSVEVVSEATNGSELFGRVHVPPGSPPRPVGPKPSPGRGSANGAPAGLAQTNRAPGHRTTTLDGAQYERRRKPPPRKPRSKAPFYLGALLVLAGIGAGAYVALGDQIRDMLGETQDEIPEGGSSVSAAMAGDSTPSIDDTSSSASAIGQVSVKVKLVDPESISPAVGMAELVFKQASNEICYDITAEGLGSPFQSSIKAGGRGETGLTVVDFGSLEEPAIGCVAVEASVMSSVLNGLDVHHVEARSQSGVPVIRAQLSEVMEDGQTFGGPPADDETADTEPDGETAAEVDLVFDADGGGAFAVLESGRLELTGAVAGQAVADRLVAEFTADGSGIVVVDQLVIDDAAVAPAGMIRLAAPGLFQISSAEIADGDDVDLVATLLAGRDDWTVEVVGHTDGTGNADANQRLSEQRAQSVVDRLVESGVDAARLSAVGAGASQLIADDSTEEGRIQNRRIELLITLP